MRADVSRVMYQLLRGSVRGEGMRDRMYLDVKGIVTVGVGMALMSEAAVRRFNWNVSAAEAVRQWRQIRDEGRRLREQGGRITNQARSSARTTEADVRRLFPWYLREIFEPRLIEQFPQWEEYPGDAQLGALVHLWGLGQNALRPVSRWPNYKRAVLDRDWHTAEREALYRPIRACRREDLQTMFWNAGRVEAAQCDGLDYHPHRVYFPRKLLFMSRTRWRGVAAARRG